MHRAEEKVNGEIGEVGEIKIEMETDIFHPLDHFPRGCNNQGRPRTKPGVRNSLSVSYRDKGD